MQGASAGQCERSSRIRGRGGIRTMLRHLRIGASVLTAVALASSGALAQQRDTTLQPPVGGRDTIAVVAGRIVDGAGEPVEGAEVSVGDGAPGTRTDHSGAFRLGDVPAGPQELRVRRVGFHPVTLAVTIPAGGATDYVITLERTAQALPEVVIDLPAPTFEKLSPFFHRKQFGQGTFFTRDQIEQAHLFRLSDVFRRAPGLRVVPTGATGYIVASSRGMISATRPCRVALYVDGVRYGSGGDIDEIALERVAAVETYSGPATTPQEFGGTAAVCGVVVIWLRDGSV